MAAQTVAALAAVLDTTIGRTALAGAVAYGVTAQWPDLLEDAETGLPRFPGLLDQQTVVMMTMFAAWRWSRPGWITRAASTFQAETTPSIPPPHMVSTGVGAKALGRVDRLSLF